MRRLAEKRATQRQAAEALGITPRHLRRLYEAYAADGAGELTSKRRGLRSNRATPDEVRLQALAIVRSLYPDFGPTFAQVKLVELHGLAPALRRCVSG
ncbi:MAG: transposase [Myxococcaceae bacterium]|nr:transposase [Myxococcaceae bacterium]